jgi:flagellar biogenesis protein FliO
MTLYSQYSVTVNARQAGNMAHNLLFLLSSLNLAILLFSMPLAILLFFKKLIATL